LLRLKREKRAGKAAIALICDFGDEDSGVCGRDYLKQSYAYICHAEAAINLLT